MGSRMEARRVRRLSLGDYSNNQDSDNESHHGCCSEGGKIWLDCENIFKMVQTGFSDESDVGHEGRQECF